MLKRVCALTLVIALLLLPVSAIDGERIARRGPGGTGKLALTFDDGPHPKYTEQILAILKEYDCKATFFVIGENVRAHPELLKAVNGALKELTQEGKIKEILDKYIKAD